MTKIKIGDLIDRNIILEHKDGNYGSLYPRQSEFGEEGIPFLTAKLIDNSGRLLFDKAQRLNEEKANKFSFGWIQEDDVLLSHNATIGRVTVVPKIEERMLVGTSLTYYRLDKNKLLPSYFATYLSSKEFQDQLRAVMSYSTRDQVPITIQRDLFIEVPDFPTQVMIGNIYSNFSRKIELNQKTNETLEKIAKALFKSWFIDFDPVKAKSEGRSTALPDEISDLFPDSFQDSELGTIPSGWDVSVIGDVSENFDRKRVPLSKEERSRRKGNFPYFGATGIFDYVDDFLFDGVYLLIGEDGSVEKENGTAFTQYVKGKIWVNNHAHILTGIDPISTEFLYCFFQFFKINPYITGAVQLKLSQGRMNMISLPLADKNCLKIFDQQVKPIFSKIILKKKESLIISSIRDTFLPKLISGELRIPDVEQIIEEAGI